MPPNLSKPELPASPELPNFSDRLPDLTQVLRQAGRELAEAKPAQSYVPYFEDVYAVAHSLKGVTRILSCPKPMEDFIIDLNVGLVRALSGTAVCRKLKESGAVLIAMADAHDIDHPAEASDLGLLKGKLDELFSLYSEDVAHEARLNDVPPHLFYVNEFVSKKAREITLLNLNHTVVEAEALLDDIPLWRTQLNEALVSPEFGRGMVVNFLPFLNSEGSRSLKLWAWVAAASYSRASL
ncbi:MAG: hypothetical protein ACXVC0_21375, partial [Bdellovibrionota bacterium]